MEESDKTNPMSSALETEMAELQPTPSANQVCLADAPEAPLLTKRELWLGWYGYDWANSVYATVAISLFFPLLVVDLATKAAYEQQGIELYPNCNDTVSQECFQCMPGYGSTLMDANGQTVDLDVTVQAGMIQIQPAAYASFCISMSVLVQVLFFISFGPLGDYGPWKKRLLRITSPLGAALTLCGAFLFEPWMYWIGGLLIILSNTIFGLSIVYYNAYLALLVDSTPEVVQALKGRDINYQKIREGYENLYSQNGYMSGYISGVVLLVVCLGLYLVLKMPDDAAYQLFLGLTGVWWIIFGTIAVESFHLRPGPPRPQGRNWLVESWASTFRAVRSIRKHRQAFQFLLLFFMFSDGVSTVSSVGILFAQRDLCMSPSEAVIVAVIIPLMAAVGNFTLLRIQRLLNAAPKTMLLFSLWFFLGIVLWGCIGFFSSSFGLRQKWEIYLFGVLYGFNLGSVQSYSRCIFTDIIPPGSESQFFSLYEVSDKGSSWIGPLIVAIIIQGTGEIRLGLVYLAFAIGIPTILVHFLLDHKQGMVESGRHVDVKAGVSSGGGPDAA